MISDKPNAPCACACGGEPNEAELLERLDSLLQDWVGQPGGLIPALQAAQGLFGYLPEAALKRISERFNKPYSEVAGVVTFYSFFSTRPRGRHMVRVCLGTACYVRGGKQVLDAFRRELGIEVGDTTADREFTLEVARCFGACGLAPAISVDDEVHQRVKPSRVGDILESYRKPLQTKES